MAIKTTLIKDGVVHIFSDAGKPIRQKETKHVFNDAYEPIGGKRHEYEEVENEARSD